MKKRSLALVLVGAMSLAMLASCSPKDPDSSTPDASVPSTSTPDVSTPDVSTPDVSTPDVSTPDISTPETEVPDIEFAMSNTDFTLFAAGESYKLTVTNLLPSDKVVYTIDNEEVATISENGTVTAVAEGTATVTAVITIEGMDEMTLTSIVRCTFKDVNPDADVDLLAFYEAVAASYEMGGLGIVEGELLAGSYPGLESIDLAQSAIYVSMMTMSSSEIALVEVANEEDVDAVKALLQARIDAQVDGGAWYPSAIEIWQKNSRIVSNGNYVMMIVAETPDEIVAEFNALFEA